MRHFLLRWLVLGVCHDKIFVPAIRVSVEIVEDIDKTDVLVDIAIEFLCFVVCDLEGDAGKSPSVLNEGSYYTKRLHHPKLLANPDNLEGQIRLHGKEDLKTYVLMKVVS